METYFHSLVEWKSEKRKGCEVRRWEKGGRGGGGGGGGGGGEGRGAKKENKLQTFFAHETEIHLQSVL